MDDRPIPSFDGSTRGKVCCKKIETGWRIVNGNGKICIDLKRSVMRYAGYYMYCVFYDHNRVDKQWPCAIDAGILSLRNTCSTAY